MNQSMELRKGLVALLFLILAWGLCGAGVLGLAYVALFSPLVSLWLVLFLVFFWIAGKQFLDRKRH